MSTPVTPLRASQVVKNQPANAGDLRDRGSIVGIPGSGRSPGGGNGNPLQYSCLENPMDRGAWWATVRGVTKSQTHLNNSARMHTRNITKAYCPQHLTAILLSAGSRVKGKKWSNSLMFPLNQHGHRCFLIERSRGHRAFTSISG